MIRFSRRSETQSEKNKETIPGEQHIKCIKFYELVS